VELRKNDAGSNKRA
jgi:DNA replication licensing factor MCM6